MLVHFLPFTSISSLSAHTNYSAIPLAISMWAFPLSFSFWVILKNFLSHLCLIHSDYILQPSNCNQFHGAESLLRSQQLLRHSKKFPAFHEIRKSKMSSQETSIGLYPELDKFSSHTWSYFSQFHSNITPSPTYRSS
jgi:hypothetical protein